MKKILLILITLASPLTFAAPIEGKWQTIDENGQPKAVVSIAKKGDSYAGTIVSLASGVKNECPGCKSPQPLIGMTVLRNLKEKDGEYEGGKIFDPKNGKTYSAKAKLVNGGNALNVRGYLGVSALGRTQTWKRVH